MKKLFVKLFVFMLPLLAALFYLELQLSKVPNSYNKKKKYLEQQLGQIQVLQLGSSQALFGINPTYFSHYGFNLSNVSQSLFYDTRITLNYLDRMPSLKLIIVSISYFSFRYQIENGLEGWRDDFYYTFWHIRNPVLPVFSFQRYSKLLLYKMSPVRGMVLKRFKIDLAPDLQYNGFDLNSGTDTVDKISDVAAQRTVSYHNSMMDKSESVNNYNYIKELMAAAKKRNIRVVFIIPPCYETYYKHASPEIVAENDSLLRVLCTGTGSAYYNYFTDKRFAFEDFRDNDHLNVAGAAKFSRILDSEVIRPSFSAN